MLSASQGKASSVWACTFGNQQGARKIFSPKNGTLGCPPSASWATDQPIRWPTCSNCPQLLPGHKKVWCNEAYFCLCKKELWLTFQFTHTLSLLLTMTEYSPLRLQMLSWDPWSAPSVSVPASQRFPQHCWHSRQKCLPSRACRSSPLTGCLFSAEWEREC